MTVEVCDALQTLRKPQMLLIHGHGVAETQMIINLKRRTVKQEEDPWVSAAIPRYTTVPLCKCFGKACNSSVYACLGGCAPHLHVVSAVRMEMSKISPEAMGKATAFLFIITELLCFFKQDKKTFQNQESPPRTKDTQEKLQYMGMVIYCELVLFGGVSCV